jgi:hypothetical protein
VDGKGEAFEVKKVEPLSGPISPDVGVSTGGQRFLTPIPLGSLVDKPLTVV